MWGVLRGYAASYAGARLAGRRSTFYGITMIYRENPQPFREDLPKLFELLRQGAIRPRIAARLGLLEGRKAQEMLEAGGIDGKIVLVREQLRPEHRATGNNSGGRGLLVEARHARR